MRHRQSSNHPIIVGAGQITRREKIQGDQPGIYDLIRQAVAACAQDTGCPGILQQLDALGVVSIISEHSASPLPGVCAACGIEPALQEETVIGGNSAQWLVNRMAARIMRGEIKLALLTGGEALYRDVHFSQLMSIGNFYARYAGDARVAGDTRRWETAHEILHGLDRAPHIYPLFENALRAHLGLTPAAYRVLLNSYFTNLAATASANPYAWFPQGKAFADITEASPANPLFNYPYTKYMNPVLPVNQAAALIMTDTQTALRLGVPREKWVYLCSGVDGADTWFITDRLNYYSSPVARLSCRAALEAAGLELADINFFDLYTCFPCAPFITARELGLDLENLPPLSITGGLPYFGGPGSNYSMHAVAHAVARLRQHPEEYGLITAWGSYLTKHSVGIYSGRAPRQPWDGALSETIRPQLGAQRGPAIEKNPAGMARVETYTVLHVSADGLAVAIIIARLENGARCLALSSDPAVTAIMEQAECVGQRVSISPGNGLPNRFTL